MEFHTVKNEPGHLVLTAKQWRDETGNKKENMRDYASVEPLIILVNIESMNADMIREGIPMSERLKKLRSVAYYQMQSLTRNKSIVRIKDNLIDSKSDKSYLLDSNTQKPLGR